MASGCGSASNAPPTKPPMRMPAAKNKLQVCLRQSYLKKSMPAGKQAAHTCRMADETPNNLLPAINSTGTVRPTNTPPAYHGQGSFKNENIAYDFCYLRLLYKLHVPLQLLRGATFSKPHSTYQMRTR